MAFYVKYEGGRLYSVWKSSDGFYTGRRVYQGSCARLLGRILGAKF